MQQTERIKFHQGELYDAYARMGCSYDENTGRATFTVFCPTAKKVSVVGDFNGWSVRLGEMQCEGDGIYSVTLDNIKTFDGYKYAIETADGRLIYKCDPYALHRETEEQTNAKVYPISRIKVNDKEYWEKKKKQDKYCQPINIYEAHIGSWKKYPDGNYYSYRKFADEIVPYLKTMRYTHLELIGVSEHPFCGSWGYQVTGYFAPTSRYGTPEDFCYLVEKLHKNNLGLIIDWVPGHFPKNADGLYEFDGQPFYEPSHPLRREHKEWGTMCFDYGKGEVQTLLCSSACMWFDLYHVDGLRVDAVASMLYHDYGRTEWLPNRLGGNENEEAIAFIKKLNSAVSSRFPEALMIAEDSTEFSKVTKPVSEGGLGFTYKWNMGWMNDTLDYAEKDPFFRKDIHDNLTFSLTYAFNENYVLPISHDEVVHGKFSLINKMPGDYELKFAGQRNFLMNMYAHPGKKLLMMGCEFGQFIEWDEKRELDWFLLSYPAHDYQHRFTKTLNKVYKLNASLWEQDGGWSGFKWHVVDDKNNNVYVYERFDKKGNSTLVILNFSPVKLNGYRFGVDKGTYTTRLSSSFYGWSEDRVKYKAENIPSHGYEYSLCLDIEPMSGIYMTKKNRGQKR